MRRCTALRASCFTRTGLGCQPRRWVSYDKTDLTKEALLEKVESGLGEDVHGNPLKIDPDSKTVETAAGTLPISPLFDPVWMKARRRQTKDDSKAPVGRFRKKLSNNPYARALSTPLRRCSNTTVVLPRFFFQDFELVKHPTKNETWWTPGPLSTELVEPGSREAKGLLKEEGLDAELDSLEDSDAAVKVTDDAETAAIYSHEDTTTNEAADPTQPWRPRRAPVTVYSACRKPLIDALDSQYKRTGPVLAGPRHGMGVPSDSRRAQWRPDTSGLLLQLFRRKAVDALIARAPGTPENPRKFVQPCASWDAVKDVMLRGCVLWLPADAAAARGEYATLDVQGVSYGGKMAVHNLHWLLGEDEVGRLRQAAEVFRDNEILVLTQRRNVRVMRLHMLLWRLHGFLAEAE